MLDLLRRSPFISNEIGRRLHAYVGGVIRDLRGTLLIANGVADHEHLLARLGSDVAISEAIRHVKTGSSKWIHQTFSGAADFRWQSGYAAFTVSESQVERVRAYIANQQAHQTRVSFEDEYKALLRAHNVEFDERHIFD